MKINNFILFCSEWSSWNGFVLHLFHYDGDIFNKSLDNSLFGINFSKNFGQHAATMCGFKHAKGEFVITLDDDLEAHPNEIEKLIDNIIKSNREREEKEKLFRSKVQELKGIFEKQKLEDLKGLKFDVDEITSIINSNGEEDNGPRDSKGTTTIEDSAKKVD